jgi:type IV pilus assembly protein PilM
MKLFSFGFRKKYNSCLGIDIGTYSIKIVELAEKDKVIFLKNYAEFPLIYPEGVSSGAAKPYADPTNSTYSSSEEIAKFIKTAIKEAEIETNEANLSLPDFATFFTNFKLPLMSEEELNNAVKYEARSYIPLPFSEITLDWKVAENNSKIDNKNQEVSKIKIIVAAVSNDIINKYKRIAEISGLKINSLESEVFTLQRSIAPEKDKIVAVIDIGARSTTCSVFKEGVLNISHSFNFSGNALTDIIIKGKGVNYFDAENLKKEYGLLGIGNEGKEIRDLMIPLVDVIVGESYKTFKHFIQEEGLTIDKVILVGGSAVMPGLKEYLEEEFNRNKENGNIKTEVEIGNPFKNLTYPQELSEILQEIGPNYAIAIGSALKKFEK